MDEKTLDNEQKDDKRVYYGIDLGTTFSIIARYKAITNEVEVIPDEDSSGFLVPSAVFYPEDGDPVVGQAALNMQAQAPERLVKTIKMSMGTAYIARIGDKEYTPEEVSAEILKKLRRNAEIYTGEIVDSVVITVPAYFGDAERAATLKAAEIAGWDVDWKNPDNSKVRLLAEPSAAALAYVIEAKVDIINKNILVSDLGGGTYDVTFLQAKEVENEKGKHLNIRIVCKEGSKALGGEHWDNKLEEYVIDQCLSQEGHSKVDPRSDKRLSLPLREQVVRGKINLSKMEETKIPCCTGREQKVSRGRFEELTAGLLLQAEQRLRKVLKMLESPDKLGYPDIKAPILPEDIEPALLVGGSSKMPMLQEMVKRITGKEAQVHRSVDLLVAIGAAYDAFLVTGQEIVVEKDIETTGEDGESTTMKEVIIIKKTEDIVRTSVGIEMRDDREDSKNYGKDINVIIVPGGTPVGKEYTRGRDDDPDKLRFVTGEENQRAVPFRIHEGDSEELENCVFLGEAILDLPPNQPKGTRVIITLKYDENGIITGKGICKTTEGDREVDIRIERAKLKIAK